LCLSEPIKEHVTILSTSIFSQESFAKNEIVQRLASAYDVKHELFGPEDPPASVRLRTVHPSNLNTGSFE
jgi:hypothetical protein